MNLKESFRYQNFLDTLMKSAGIYIQDSSHCFKVTKRHLKSKANPDAEDVTEVEERSGDVFEIDKVIEFMTWLVTEREKLTAAIGKAKASVGFDIDAAVETNKFRQQINSSLKCMLRFKAGKSITQGRDYRFNNEGNQMGYYYDVEVETEEDFNRDDAKRVMRDMIAKADKVSSDIDAALINTPVEYLPRFDVNESFADVMSDFIGE